MRLIQVFLVSLLMAACDQGAQQSNSESSATFDQALYQFTASDIQFLQQLSISQLGKPPHSESNQFADNEAAAKLGQQLFFDPALSQSGQFSCATCHQPEHYFTDALAFSKAVGSTARSTPSVLGASYSEWQFWDGRKDSLWSQALAPIEDQSELNTTRVNYVRLLLTHYAADYQAVFGEFDPAILAQLPASASPLGNADAQSAWQVLDDDLKDQVNRVFSNAGKAMMAYQRQLVIPLAPFDRFIDALETAENDQSKAESEAAKIDRLKKILAPSAVSGLRLFVGKANCISCHNGPLFTNHEFHNVGAPDLADRPVELGRHSGVQALLKDEFTCLSPWSDAPENACSEMRFLKTEGVELVGALKTPSLRNIGATAPYMQFGQFANLQQVISHYNQPTPPVYNREQHPSRPHFDIMPLSLTEQEQQDLESFLHALTSPLPVGDSWWGLGH